MVEKTFPDRYQNLARIGAGGMGEVYQASDTLLLKTVAIKVLRKRMSKDATVRFHIEAKATARLNHPNIVGILDFGTTEDLSPYMVMEFLEGENLAVFLDQQEVIPIETFLQIFLQVCAALSHAHKRQILHRDLKPSNLIVLVEGKKVSIKLVDFGIAKIFEEDQSITSTGAILGSPLYMSPEQASGQEADQRSDIYSIGCLMYECLAGRPPFRGATAMETMQLHQTEEPTPLCPPGVDGDVSLWLDAIVMKCLNKDPEERYQSVDDLRIDLIHGYEESGMENPEVDKVVEVFRPRSPFAGSVMVLLVVLILLGTLVVARQGPVAKLPPANQLKREDVSFSPREESQFSFITEPGAMYIEEKNKLRVNDLTDDQLVQCAKYPEPYDVDLVNCEELTGSGLKYLIARSPRTLRFRSEIQDRYFKYMGEMKDLSLIMFSNLKKCDGSGFLSLKGLKKLKKITVQDSYVNNAMLKNISQIENVKMVMLPRSSGFDATGLSYLKSHELHFLDLTDTHLDDKILTGLRGMTVVDLSIASNPSITDESCSVLESLKLVRVISLGDTGISTAGRLKLAASLGLRYQPTDETASKTSSRNEVEH